MASIRVDSAFVEDVLIGNNGAWGLKTSEPHSRKNDQDKWETVGRTYRTVKVPRSSGILLETFTKGDRITFEGRELTESRKSADGGKTFHDLVCWADSITRAGNSPQRAQEPQDEPMEPYGDPWATTSIPESDVPF
jgi:hypothetical protein